MKLVLFAVAALNAVNAIQIDQFDGFLSETAPTLTAMPTYLA